MVDIYENAEEAARMAGEALLVRFRDHIHVENKQDGSPVTQADIESNEIISQYLARTKIPVVSEEAFVSVHPKKKYWLIDPLDGTKEFISGNPEFTINIALIEGNLPVAGIVYAPALGEMYVGGKKESPQLIINGSEKEIESSACVDQIRILVSRHHNTTDLDLFVRQNNIQKVTSMGSSLKYCRIAAGEAEFSPRLVGSSEWDTAAAQVILEGAGGGMINWHTKRRLTYGKKNWRNPRFLAFRYPLNPNQFTLREYKEELL